MGTLIGTGGGNNYGGVRRIHGWTTMPYHERSLYDIFRQISSVSEGSGVFNVVIGDTKMFYKTIHDKDENYVLTRGKTRKGVIAACFLYACNKRNVARTELDVAALFNIEVKTLTKGTKKFREIMWKKGNKVYFSPISPLVYIERFCNILNITEEHADIAKFIAYRCTKLNITNSNIPLSITGGSIYTVSMLYEYSTINVKKIEQISTVGDGTIINFYKKVINHIEHIIPRHVLIKTPMVKTIIRKT
jgi:transcription initiation factor TFIIIB Brf1 subunit/transcription initiation factor TFIIB